MGLPAFKFDTLALVKSLREVGVDERQAEVYAESQAHVIQMLQDEQLVTKDDIHRLELEIVKTHQEINDAKRDIAQALTLMEINLKQEMKALIIDLKQEMKALKSATVMQLSVILGGLLGVISLLHWIHVL